MSLTRLNYFVAVAEELSFTKASARLHVSQPPLTQQIQRLEDELGEKLVDRSTRRISLTPAGEALLPEARRILQQYRGLPALVHEAAQGRADAFSIGCVPSAIIGFAPKLLERYREVEPAVSIRIHELNVEEQMHMLRTSGLDIGVFRSHTPPEDSMTFDLPADDYCVAVSTKHPLAGQQTVRWSDLATERFVMADRAKASLEFDSVVANCLANGFSPDLVAEAVTGYNLVALVASGLGVAVVPGRAAALKHEGAVYRPLTPRAPAVPLHMVIRPERFNDSARHLVDVGQKVAVPTLT
ncbi:LysR family transcriptional regulator [Streptomyces sp. NPDC001604]|uniref:LysR family transcriptional regulator n=1 Tax=Streptomyces sp. NPDC001604 TaxID=3364593 RepID=UPI0036C57F0F